MIDKPPPKEKAPSQGIDFMGIATLRFGQTLSLLLTIGGGYVIGLPMNQPGWPLPFASIAFGVGLCFLNVATWAGLRASLANLAWFWQIGTGTKILAIVGLIISNIFLGMCWLSDNRGVELFTSGLFNTRNAEVQVESKLPEEERELAIALEDARAAEKIARDAWSAANDDLGTLRGYQTTPPRTRLDRRALQGRLNAAGMTGADGKPLKIDGSFGEETSRALADFIDERSALVEDMRAEYAKMLDQRKEAEKELADKRTEIKEAAGDAIETRAADIIEKQGVEYITKGFTAAVELYAAYGYLLSSFAGARKPRPMRRRRGMPGDEDTGENVNPKRSPIDPSSMPLTRHEVSAHDDFDWKDTGGPVTREHRDFISAHFAGDRDNTEGGQRPLKGATAAISKIRKQVSGSRHAPYSVEEAYGDEVVKEFERREADLERERRRRLGE